MARRISFLTASSLVFFVACGGGSSPPDGSSTSVDVRIAPSMPVSLSSGQTQQFSATVSGSNIKTVHWSCSPGGSITQSGVFSAAAAGAMTVTATSDADATKSASTVVNVTNPDADSILAEDAGGIVIMNPDGSGRRSVVTDGEGPRWMVDHWHFSYYGPGTLPPDVHFRALALATPNGSSSSIIWEHPDDYDAALSPDGLTVASVDYVPFPTCCASYYFLNATNLSSGSKVELSALLCNHFCNLEVQRQPYWSPDGKSVLYSYGFDFSVHKIMADGSNDQRLFSLSPRTDSYGAPLNPSFTHDGKDVLFDFRTDPSQPSTTVIYRVGADGNNPTQVIAGKQASTSPDGKKIVFVGPAEGLFTCNFDGSEPVLIGSGSSPSW